MKRLELSGSAIANKNGGSYDKYMVEVQRIHLLTNDQLLDLSVKAKNGDTQALEAIIKANLRFVVSVAKQYQNYGLPLEDLVNEGNCGLIKAANKFDPERGVKFISYAVWWIRESIGFALNNTARQIRSPTNRNNELRKIRKLVSRLQQDFGREEVSDDEIKEAYPEVNLLSLANLRDIPEPLSLQRSFDANSNSGSLLDILTNKNADMPDDFMESEAQRVRNKVEALVCNLKPQEQLVVRMIFGLNGREPMGEEDVADALLEDHGIDLTRQRVNQIKFLSLKKMRALLAKNPL